MVFERYAACYDALYAEKDYAAECDFVEALLCAHAAGRVRSLLDLGCGTGGHAIPLARRGYQVTGVDRSDGMLEAARAKAAAAGVTVDFRGGDLRALDLGRTFDAVLAMFAVVGYQTSNDDLLAAFRAVRRHLAPKGLFVFDAWFGPAVLAQRPTDRVKTVTQGTGRTIRIARPSLDPSANTVRVDYTVLRLDGPRLLDEANESHLLRYLFTPEVDLLCRTTGFERVHACAFGEPARAPSEKDWNVSWIARAV